MTSDLEEMIPRQEVHDLIRNFPAPVSPKGYPDFKKFFLGAIFSHFGSDYAANPAFATYSGLLLGMLRKKAPTYYITDEMRIAAANTSVPVINAIEIPFEALNILTSDGLGISIKINSFDDPSLYFLRGDLQEELDQKGIQFSSSDAQIVLSAVIFACSPDKERTFLVTGINLIPPFGENKDTLMVSEFCTGYASDFNNQDIYGATTTVGELARFVMNAVMLINCQPSLVSIEKSCVTGLGFGKKPDNEPMPVRWLGKNFSNNRTRSSTPSGRTHASPRAHWRRGHWHGYRYGEGRKTLKRKWVQPVYVNPE